MVALTLAPAISIPTLYFSRFSVAISPLSSASVAEPGLMSRILSLKYEARRASSGQAVSGSSSRRKKLAGVAGVGKSKCGLYHTSGRGGARGAAASGASSSCSRSISGVGTRRAGAAW